MAAGVRERVRHALRTEIAVAMSNLFAERGFDAVTVEEAAREVGISRATFFRYFGSKEDAVLAAVEASSVDYGAILTALPSVDGENPWQLLHRTFRHAVGFFDGSEELRTRLRMINATTSLRGRMAERRYAHEESLTHALAARIANPDAARAVTVAALAAVDLAWRRWAHGEESSLSSATEHVFAQLSAASALAPTIR